MFTAIHQITGALNNALYVQLQADLTRRKEKFYADPMEIESVPKGVDINKIEVRFRLGCRSFKTQRRSHFYIVDKEKKGINTVPESKEHKIFKEIIYELIPQNKIKFYDSNNKETLFDFDLRTLTKEKTIKFGNQTNRIDVSCDFKKEDAIYGKGIFFEIQLSKQYDFEKDKRTLQRALNNYTTVWIKYNDVWNKEEEKINDNIKLKIISNNEFLLKNKEKFIDDIRNTGGFYIHNIKEMIKNEREKSVDELNNKIEEFEQRIRKETINEIEITRKHHELVNAINQQIQVIKNIQKEFREEIDIYKKNEYTVSELRNLYSKIERFFYSFDNSTGWCKCGFCGYETKDSSQWRLHKMRC